MPPTLDRVETVPDRRGRASGAVLCQNSVPRLDEEPAACEPWTAMSFVLALLGALRASLRARTDLTLENLALRQQLALLRRRSKRPQFGRLDRAFWMWWLSHQWAGCLADVEFEPRLVARLRGGWQTPAAVWQGWKLDRGGGGRKATEAALSVLAAFG